MNGQYKNHGSREVTRRSEFHLSVLASPNFIPLQNGVMQIVNMCQADINIIVMLLIEKGENVLPCDVVVNEKYRPWSFCLGSNCGSIS